MARAASDLCASISLALTNVEGRVDSLPGGDCARRSSVRVRCVYGCAFDSFSISGAKTCFRLQRGTTEGA